MLFFAQRRDQLVHDAAVAAHELVLSFLAIQGNLRAVQRQVIQLLEDRPHGDFERRRRA
ncbi:hypothetical protein D3C87_1985940 [compost metagenome]